MAALAPVLAVPETVQAGPKIVLFEAVPLRAAPDMASAAPEVLQNVPALTAPEVLRSVPALTAPEVAPKALEPEPVLAMTVPLPIWQAGPAAAQIRPVVVRTANVSVSTALDTVSFALASVTTVAVSVVTWRYLVFRVARSSQAMFMPCQVPQSEVESSYHRATR